MKTGVFRFPQLDKLNTLPLSRWFFDCAKLIPQNVFSLSPLCLNIHIAGDFNSAFSSTKGREQERYQLHSSFSGGKLYLYKLPECDYYMFVPEEATLLRPIQSMIESVLPLSGFVWFSYMRGAIEFRTHVDLVPQRLHHVIINTPENASLVIQNHAPAYLKPNATYVFDPTQPHFVPPQAGERLHLVASVVDPLSAGLIDCGS